MADEIVISRRTVPDPSSRVPPELWREVRAWMLDNDPDGAEMLRWSNDDVSAPLDPEALAGEIVWIILCAGKSAQAARTIEKKVWNAIHGGAPVVEAYGHKARAAAIEDVWSRRAALFEEFRQLDDEGDLGRLLAWSRDLPWVGSITAFQLMKNFGADVVKPDIWLCRLAGVPDRPGGHSELRFEACMRLARPLAAATGDRIAAVDSLLWLACNKGILVVDAHGGPVTFEPRAITLRSIYEAASEPEPALPRQPDLFSI